MPVAHVTFGTNDLERGAHFYDAIMAEFGGDRTFAHDKAIGWSFPDGGPSIGITYPFDGEPANRGNGTMFALMAAGEDMVRRVHAAALAHGGSCEGPPGPRANGFYAAYFRDPDGNKMNAFCMPETP
ncbi:MAG: glyoxalase [Novosphingobium sp.]|uniref:Lactoylglutathione lyase n=1 Tax=Novosphingobium indicum TaxID=462949 RepID=A0ABQ2JDX5_9SPHN|nr:VOC family protein [Novosphingobium indicum]MAC58810.1 glyoxalase [Novosphingobium sp.]MAC59343.1 glyoxalase [Novosphingobium sp.]GGN43989.1 lactoylglutathione lyase [Novosphingobium indicum]|tara:strand:- start:1877 stop:2257 length:381 start_codon:yes stop_codon:yes gene_type:complete